MTFQRFEWSTFAGGAPSDVFGFALLVLFARRFLTVFTPAHPVRFDTPRKRSLVRSMSSGL